MKRKKRREVIEMWDNSTIVEENLPNEVDEVVGGKTYFTPQLIVNNV